MDTNPRQHGEAKFAHRSPTRLEPVLIAFCETRWRGLKVATKKDLQSICSQAEILSQAGPRHSMWGNDMRGEWSSTEHSFSIESTYISGMITKTRKTLGHTSASSPICQITCMINSWDKIVAVCPWSTPEKMKGSTIESKLVSNRFAISASNLPTNRLFW